MRKCVENYLKKIDYAFTSKYDSELPFYLNLLNYVHLYNELDLMKNEIFTMYWNDFISIEEQEMLQDAIYDVKEKYVKLLEILAVKNNA